MFRNQGPSLDLSSPGVFKAASWNVQHIDNIESETWPPGRIRENQSLSFSNRTENPRSPYPMMQKYNENHKNPYWNQI